jgi:hypothetical protein
LVDVPSVFQRPCKPPTALHDVLAWPCIYTNIINSGIIPSSDLQSISKEGGVRFIDDDVLKYTIPLPCIVGLSGSIDDAGKTGHGYLCSVDFATLAPRQVQKYCDAYFNTFNLLYPLLDQEAFMNNAVAKSLREGHTDGDLDSILVLLVFALGQVAIEGTFDWPVSVANGRLHGFCDDLFSHPPGLGLFNEARKRLSFVTPPCSLENVQIMILQATYYRSTARQLDSWRTTVAASSACQVLLRCQVIDWSSGKGDLIKRAYWICVLTEELFHLELDLPRTQIHNLEEVPLPHFQELQDQQKIFASLVPSVASASASASAEEERDYHGYHFLALITLRRHVWRKNDAILTCERNIITGEPPVDDRMVEKTYHDLTTSIHSADVPNYYGGPHLAVILELEGQLNSWRTLLPKLLQRSDNEVTDIPIPNTKARKLGDPLLGAEQDLIPSSHVYYLDIITAQLRNRFYYVRFMVHQPFIYKALHFPDLMTLEDCHFCALAIKSICLWPLAKVSLQNRTHSVPHMWDWPQHSMGALLILDSCSTNDCLRRIIRGGLMELREIEQTVQLMLESLRSAKQNDRITERSWNLVKSLFGSRLRFEDRGQQHEQES